MNIIPLGRQFNKAGWEDAPDPGAREPEPQGVALGEHGGIRKPQDFCGFS